MAEILNLNGKTHKDSPYAAWVIVCQGGRTLVGLPHVDGRDNRSRFLSPVFEIQDFVLPTPQGPFSGMNIRPFLGFESVRRLPIIDGAFEFELVHLDKEDFAGVTGALENAQAKAQAARSAKAGITLAHQVPDGIKPPGTR